MSGSTFEISYTAKDLILYALAIGCGSQADRLDQELKFLYENHLSIASKRKEETLVGREDIQSFVLAIPTFAFTFTFWAEKGDIGTNRIPIFPPAMMRHIGVIPKQYLRSPIDLSLFPVLHTWQSIKWHKPLPIPLNGQSVPVELKSRVIEVTPKGIGTFVTSETVVDTKMVNWGAGALCTIQSGALVLGMPKSDVESLSSAAPRMTRKPLIPDDRDADFCERVPTSPSQSIIYRIASGDSNGIHVDPSISKKLGLDRNRPILHGLCVMGLVFRSFLRLDTDAHQTVEFMEGKFVQPICVGDELKVIFWESIKTLAGDKSLEYVFQVSNEETGLIVIDHGLIAVRRDARVKQSNL